MRRRITLALVSLFVSTSVLAQPGSVGLFGTLGGTDCNVLDVAPQLIQLWVVHVASAGATGVEFSAPPPACFLATFLAVQHPFVIVPPWDNIITGLSVPYGTCAVSPITVCEIDFFGSGTTGNCCYYPVLPRQGLSSVQVWDCSSPANSIPTTGGVAIINPDASCQCDVAARGSTWGGVKALYTD